RVNSYPMREFLARGRKDTQIKNCRHCQPESESCSYIIGYCPAVQDARIKRHNQLCELSAEEAKKKEWVIFQEPLLKDHQNELYKPGLIFVKGGQAFVVDLTVRYESKPSSFADAVAEKVRKYQEVKEKVQEVTNASNIKFIGFPIGAHGKWYEGNYGLLAELGVSSSRQEKVARCLSNRALFTSVDTVHICES
ncbi:PO24 protein, partial [Thalassarche chlororhynchos]|nr:PO24 protein [Thalassarche chlororhynchos]